MTDGVGGRERHTGERLELRAGESHLIVSASGGGRIASLTVAGQEVIVTEGADPLVWGCYPMVPFAGRIRDGRFTYRGRTVSLPLTKPPHAIHGTTFDRPWTIAGDDALTIDLGPDWPFSGRVTQRFALRPDGLRVELDLEADEAMPGAVGWHPWFRRVLAGSAGRPNKPSPPVELRFEAAKMWLRGDDGLPTGRVVAPGPHPWDDCFTGLRAAPRLTWPGVLSIEIDSSCDQWVVYEEAPHAVCVEPQSSPPDATNLAPVTVESGATLSAWMAWRWWPDGETPVRP